jgi:hypothetical protein
MGITTIARERNMGEAVDECHEGPWRKICGRLGHQCISSRKATGRIIVRGTVPSDDNSGLTDYNSGLTALHPGLWTLQPSYIYSPCSSYWDLEDRVSEQLLHHPQVGRTYRTSEEPRDPQQWPLHPHHQHHSFSMTSLPFPSQSLTDNRQLLHCASHHHPQRAHILRLLSKLVARLSRPPQDHPLDAPEANLHAQ